MKSSLLANLGIYSSKSRNKLIAKAFKEIDLIEQFGCGIKRICDICTAYGLIELTFEERNGGFLVTMYAKKSVKEENVPENRLIIIINTLQTNPNCLMQRLSQVCNVDIETIKRDI